MSFPVSIVLLVLSVGLCIGMNHYDKTHEGDHCRVYIAISGVLAMMSFFYTLLHLALRTGLLR